MTNAVCPVCKGPYNIAIYKGEPYCCGACKDKVEERRAKRNAKRRKK